MKMKNKNANEMKRYDQHLEKVPPGQISFQLIGKRTYLASQNLKFSNKNKLLLLLCHK